MEYLIIIISAIFVNNILLAQFLGCCPFLGVSNKLSTAVGMSGAVCFVITLSTLVTYLLQYYVLVPLHIEFMQTITFILVIAALVQMVEIILKKISPSLLCRARYRTHRRHEGVHIRQRSSHAQPCRVSGVCIRFIPRLRPCNDSLCRP